MRVCRLRNNECMMPLLSRQDEEVRGLLAAEMAADGSSPIAAAAANPNHEGLTYDAFCMDHTLD